MCVLLLKNTFVAIKSTRKVQVCFFYEPLSQFAMHIKACDRKEAANTQESLAVLNWLQIIYQRRPSSGANLT